MTVPSFQLGEFSHVHFSVAIRLHQDNEHSLIINGTYMMLIEQRDSLSNPVWHFAKQEFVGVIVPSRERVFGAQEVSTSVEQSYLIGLR